MDFDIAGMVLYPLVAAIGALAQIIDGALGMGFGVFSASMMIAAGLAPAVAVAVVNAAKVFTGLSSGAFHWRFGNVRRDWLLPLIGAGIVGGWLGAYLLTSVPPQVTRPWVSLLLVIMGILIVWRSLRQRIPCETQAWDNKCADCPQQKRSWQRLVSQTKNNSAGKLGALGFLAALVNGFSGAYGPIATSGVMLLEKGEPRHAVGTVNLAEFFVAATVAFTILWRQGLSQFPIGLVLALAIGGAITAPLAAYICRRVPPRGLAFLVGALVILLNIRSAVLLATGLMLL